jgi:hypothetical protein
MPNLESRAYCDDCFAGITDGSPCICGACADNLKAERDRLIAEVAELEKEKYYFAARLLDKYSQFMCPPDSCGNDRKRSGYCDGDNSDCTRCWLEFLMKEEK